MKPERLDLPAKVLQAPVRDAPEAVAGERVRELVELCQQGARVRIAPTLRARQRGELRPRATQPLRDGAEAAAVRLAREPLLELAHRLRKIVGVGEEAARDGRRSLTAAGLRRDVDHQPRGHLGIAVEDVVGVDAQRLEGRLGGDERVPVPVAADPRPPAQEGRHDGGAGTGPSGVGCRRIFRKRSAQPVEGRVEDAVDARGDSEEGCVEEDHCRTHLVQRCRPLAAQVGGAPQDGDLLPEATSDLCVAGRRQSGVVEAVEEAVDAAQGEQDRATPGFRGMGGQDGRDAQAAETGSDGLQAFPVRGDARDRRGDGAAHRLAASAPLTPAQDPDTLLLLGKVRELEERAEGMGQDLQALEVERRKLRVEGDPVGIHGMPSKRDGVPAHALHEVQRRRPILLRDHLAQERPEEPDLPGQRIPGAGGPDRARLGTKCAAGGGAHPAQPGSAPAVAPLGSAPPARARRARPRASSSTRPSRASAAVAAATASGECPPSGPWRCTAAPSGTSRRRSTIRPRSQRAVSSKAGWAGRGARHLAVRRDTGRAGPPVGAEAPVDFGLVSRGAPTTRWAGGAVGPGRPAHCGTQVHHRVRPGPRSARIDEQVGEHLQLQSPERCGVAGHDPADDAADVDVDRADATPERDRSDRPRRVRTDPGKRLEVGDTARDAAAGRGDRDRRPVEGDRAAVVAEAAPRSDHVGGAGGRHRRGRRERGDERRPVLLDPGDLCLLGHYLGHQDAPRVGGPRRTKRQVAPVSRVPVENSPPQASPSRSVDEGARDGRAREGPELGGRRHARRIPAALVGNARRPQATAPSGDPSRPLPRLGSYLAGITRVAPTRKLFGSTPGLAALRAARVTPSFWAIAYMVSPFLIV